MIARREKQPDRADVWTRLAEPIDPALVEWRQDGKIIQRDDRYFARFVAYVSAVTVRDRLDAVVPGDWDLTLECLPQQADADGVAQIAFKARLCILGCIREDVGQGRDYKAAATDAFKRAAVRFGIGRELHGRRVRVEMSGDGKNARPLEDPRAVYARSAGGNAPNAGANGGGSRAEGQVGHSEQQNGRQSNPTQVGGAQSSSPRATADAGAAPSCPQCGGEMWDNRAKKASGEFSARAPDFRCKDKACEGAIWPQREGKGRARSNARQPVAMGAHIPGLDDEPPADNDPFDPPY